ncbi:uncharacterized protein LOC112569571 isoform X3 [Pomacea canaliculata]|nr:uncharacterized protein LOC112569571 isoform X3 [Pomacea canaliculata]
MSVNDWFNATFSLDKCGDQTYLITVERKEQNHPVILCRIHHNKMCIKTSNQAIYSCRCVSPSGPVEFSEKLVRPGNVEYRWRWTDLTSGKNSEKEMFVFVIDKESVSGMTTMKFVISALCSFVLVVVAVILLSTFCKKLQLPTTTKHRKVQLTPWGCTQLGQRDHNNPPPAVTVRSREESRCENPVNVEDVYDRAIHDPRRNPPGPRRVEQQAQMEMFTNELYEEKAL